MIDCKFRHTVTFVEHGKRTAVFDVTLPDPSDKRPHFAKVAAAFREEYGDAGAVRVSRDRFGQTTLFWTID